jgi:DNA transposition AAA+ family ATPase
MKPYTPELRDQLAAYRAAGQLTLTDLARELGTNPSQVSRYLAGKPEGDVVRLENVIEDVLLNDTRRRQALNPDFETPITRSLRACCETIRETNDVALICGPAGIGKTCGCRLYAAANPSCFLVTVPTWRRHQVDALIFAQVATRGCPPNTNRGDFLAAKLARSNRLVIVDNAHKLARRSLGWLFDFHDTTDCPIALVGNPEILGLLKTNDQWYSRIGQKRELKLKPGKARPIVEKLIAQILPEAADALDLAETVAEHHGHFRAVRKQLLLARAIREKDETRPDWPTAFKMAHLQSVRDYALE